MRSAETILSIIRQCSQRALPVKDVYRLLYQRDLYLLAYGKIHKNSGAMTEGATKETVDGMSLEKIDNIIQALRYEKYQWTPVRRIYIPKKNGKRRPLGIPIWSDKLLAEVIRSILEAYYEPKFSDNSHGFRPNRGCHTALREVSKKGRGTKWFIEGDLCACFDRIDHTILLNILRQDFPDNRFMHLMSKLLDAGYLEDWKFNTTLSGVPQGNVLSPLLSNIILDRLDKYVENLIPIYTRGARRKVNPTYNNLNTSLQWARKKGNWKRAHELLKQMQLMPSRDTHDDEFRRLWYVRYADDFLLGLSGPKNEAVEIKNKIAEFLRNDLKLELNHDKTLVTHAHDECAKFLGYEVTVIHENSKHDFRGRRSINGMIGLRVPLKVARDKCTRYMRDGKSIHIGSRTHDTDYDIVTRYQSEFRGVVQYYKMAYNLNILSHLRYMMERSLVKTLACKYKTTSTKIYKKYNSTIMTDEGKRKVLLVKIDREPPKKPLITYFGAISLKWNKWSDKISINDKPITLGFQRNAIIDRLLAQKCELCDATEKIEVHHIKKLSNLNRNDGKEMPHWKKMMITRKRKTLVVCKPCHVNIHRGQYDGEKRVA